MTSLFRNVAKTLAVISLFATLITLSLAATPSTHTVCESLCDYQTIQGAIDDIGVNEGDTLSLTDSMYVMTVGLSVKAVNIVGQGSAVTTIDGDGADYTVILNEVEGVSISDVEITGSTLANVLFTNAGNSNSLTDALITDGEGAGIKFESSDSNTISGTNISGNDVGAFLLGTSTGNSINDSVFSSNTSYDVTSESTDDNYIKNSDFTNSTLSGDGEIEVYYKMKGYVHDGEIAEGSATVELLTGTSTVAFTDTTEVDGYTDFSNYLYAYSLSSSGQGEDEEFLYSLEWGTETASFTGYVLDTVNQILDIDLSLEPRPILEFEETATSETSATFGWNIGGTDQSGSFSHYEIWYGANMASVESRGTGATEFDTDDDSTLATETTDLQTITGLSSGTTYYFKAWAVNVFGNEVESATVSVSTDADEEEQDSTGSSSSSHHSSESSEESSEEESEPEEEAPSEETTTAEEQEAILTEATQTITEAVTEAVAEEVAVPVVDVVEPIIIEETPAEESPLTEEESEEMVTEVADIVAALELEETPAEEGSEEETPVLEIAPELEEIREVIEERQTIAEELAAAVEEAQETGEVVDQEVVQEAEESLTRNIQETIERSSGQGEVVAHLDGVEVLISADTVKVALGSANTAAELKEKQEEADKEGKVLIVLGDQTDVDGNGLPDSMQVELGLGIFEDPDVDEDGLDAVEEVIYEGNPNGKDEIPGVPEVRGLAGKTTGRLPAFNFLGEDGKKVEVFVVHEVDMGGGASGGSARFEEPVFLGELEMEGNKGQLVVKTPLKEGKNHLVTKVNGEIQKVTGFFVDGSKTPAAPELSLTAKGHKAGTTVIYVLRTAAEIIGLEVDKPKAETPGKQLIVGTTTPGAIVYAMQKSVIISSVAIADANGEFKLEIEEELPEGEHEAITYVYDKKLKVVGNIARILFNK